MSPTLSPAVDSHCPAYPATPWPHGLPQSAHLAPGPRNHVSYVCNGCPPPFSLMSVLGMAERGTLPSPAYSYRISHHGTS